MKNIQCVNKSKLILNIMPAKTSGLKENDKPIAPFFVKNILDPGSRSPLVTLLLPTFTLTSSAPLFNHPPAHLYVTRTPIVQ